MAQHPGLLVPDNFPGLLACTHRLGRLLVAVPATQDVVIRQIKRHWTRFAALGFLLDWHRLPRSGRLGHSVAFAGCAATLTILNSSIRFRRYRISGGNLTERSTRAIQIRRPSELRCYPGTTGMYGNRTLRTGPTVLAESPSHATSSFLDRQGGETRHRPGRAAPSQRSKRVLAPTTKRADAADVHYRQSARLKGNRSDRIAASSR